MPYVFETFSKSGKPHPRKRFQFTDWSGKRRTATGTTSWRETRKLAERVQAEHDEIRKGFRAPPNPARQHAKRPFSDVKEEYLNWGGSQGGRGGRPWGRGHARMRQSLLNWWETQLGLCELGDIESGLPRVEEELRELQKRGLAGKTLSNYAESLFAFCRWCAQKSRQYLETNPLDGLGRFDTTARTRRRAMTADEIRKVLAVAPEARKLLYEVAFCSGLRANELRQLSIGDLDLERRGLHLDASWTKDRKSAFQALPAELVRRLQAFLQRESAEQLYQRHYARRDGDRKDIPPEPLLYVPTHSARSLDADLRRAGIDKENPSGKIDFHACRVAYINFVLSVGASVREAQTLARHATADMTLNVYGRTVDTDLRALVGVWYALPESTKKAILRLALPG